MSYDYFKPMDRAALSAHGIRYVAKRAATRARGRPALRWALAAISDPREGAASVVLSLGLGLSVLAAVGQIDGTLRNAMYKRYYAVGHGGHFDCFCLGCGLEHGLYWRC